MNLEIYNIVTFIDRIRKDLGKVTEEYRRFIETLDGYLSKIMKANEKMIVFIKNNGFISEKSILDIDNSLYGGSNINTLYKKYVKYKTKYMNKK